MQNHFKRSLSAVQKGRCLAVVKWQAKLSITFTMNNGGFQRGRWQADAIVIRRGDILHVHDYAQKHCPLRDFLLIRLPMKIGLRTGEISTLKIENIDFLSHSFYVLDSKRKELYPLPLDMVTLSLIQDLIKNRLEGYVFTRSHSWRKVKQSKPLSIEEIWHVVRKIGVEAGVPNLNPRLLRCFFAANWVYVEKKSHATLQRILRHKDPATTEIYVGKLVFFEDLQREYEGVQSQPFVSDSICNDCELLSICKHAPLPSNVTGCRFLKPKQREELNV